MQIKINKFSDIKENFKIEKNEIISWEELEQKSNKYIKHFQDSYKMGIEINNEGYILICFVADIHIGGYGVDYKKAREDAEKIAGCEYAVAFGGGDYIDNFILAKLLDPLLSQPTIPQEQINLFEKYISFFKGKLILSISGNHDRWTKQVSGLDFLYPLMEQNKIFYAPDLFLIDIYNDKVKYSICLRHKYRYNSIYNATHTVKQMLRLGENIFDIGVICHHHIAALEICYILGEERIAIRTGSYKVADTFVRKIGYNQTRCKMPCIAISLEKKKMIPFLDLEDGINFINKINE